MPVLVLHFTEQLLQKEDENEHNAMGAPGKVRRCCIALERKKKPLTSIERHNIGYVQDLRQKDIVNRRPNANLFQNEELAANQTSLEKVR